MKTAIYISIITLSLLVGFMMSNTFFRAHYLGIGEKVNLELSLKHSTNCSFNDCIATFINSNQVDPYLYQITFSAGNKAPSQIKILAIRNEFNNLCLMTLTSDSLKKDFTHFNYCNKIQIILQEEWERENVLNTIKNNL